MTSRFSNRSISRRRALHIGASAALAAFVAPGPSSHAASQAATPAVIDIPEPQVELPTDIVTFR